MKRHQLGFTLNEILVVLWMLVCLALAGGVVYAAVHFVSKFW